MGVTEKDWARGKVDKTALTAIVGVANQVDYVRMTLHWAWLRAQERDGQSPALERITFRKVIRDESIECFLCARFVVLVNAVLGGLSFEEANPPQSDVSARNGVA